MKGDTTGSYCISKCMTKEALLHAYITRVRLTACEAYFREKDHNSQKYTHPPSIPS